MPTTGLPAFALPSFNPLEFANRLKRAGVPDKQAEAEAEVLHEAITHHAEAFLSAHSKLTGSVEVVVRKAEHAENKAEAAIARLEGKVDTRFAEMEGKVDARFAEMEGKVDARFAEMEGKVDARFAEMEGKVDARFAEMDARFVLLQKEIALVRRDTIIWLGGIVIVGFGTVLTTLFRLFA